MPSFEVTPIGAVRNDRADVRHAVNGGLRSTITIDERFGEACLQGLEGFSHVEVFDRFPEHDDYRGPRSYRGRRRPDLDLGAEPTPRSTSLR
jgi:tRNA (adenine37-N6)-methyltransferase